jgi:hypothetical protein
VKLVNVRLEDEDARMAARLREEGIRLSTVVRAAIRAAYDQRARGRRGPRRLSAIMAEIYAAVPAPRGLSPRYDLRDRKSVRRAILARLRRRPRR